MSIDLQRIPFHVSSQLEVTIVDIFNNALNEKIAIGEATTEAANQLSQLVPPDASQTDAESVLMILWALLIHIAQEIPYKSQPRTALEVIVQKLHSKSVGEIFVWGSTFKLWSDLPLFGPCMRDFWDDPTLDHDGVTELDPKETSAWLNLNSFAAALAGRGCVNWSNLALWQLRTALEYTSNDKIMRLRTLVAAAWISEASTKLFLLCRGPIEIDEAIPRALAPGPLYGGKTGFTLQRWLFWRNRFKEIDDNLTPDAMNSPSLLELRDTARNAWRGMQRTEQDHGIWNLNEAAELQQSSSAGQDFKSS